MHKQKKKEPNGSLLSSHAIAVEGCGQAHFYLIIIPNHNHFVK